MNKKQIVGLSSAFALGLVCNLKTEVKNFEPIGIKDINGDQIEDVLLFTQTYSGTCVGYIDGKKIIIDSRGLYFTNASPILIYGTYLNTKINESLKNASISVEGNDIIVRTYLDCPEYISISQRFENVLRYL